MGSIILHISKALFFILLLTENTAVKKKQLMPTVDVAQLHNYSLHINGDWKCVKHDYRGIEKYTFEQAEKIRKSVLHIETNTYYFKNINFIEKCKFYEWRIRPFDAFDLVQTIERTYTKKQLKQIFLLDPVNKDGNTACYNECIVFKKRDTLITDCGGYIFYWVKLKH